MILLNSHWFPTYVRPVTSPSTTPPFSYSARSGLSHGTNHTLVTLSAGHHFGDKVQDPFFPAITLLLLFSSPKRRFLMLEDDSFYRFNISSLWSKNVKKTFSILFEISSFYSLVVGWGRIKRTIFHEVQGTNLVHQIWRSFLNPKD